MKLTYLELRNYRRFKELRLEFPSGIVGILGPNGSGKSTIIEAVGWALFGNVEEVVRTSKEGIRRADAKSTDSCSSVLEFELDGAEYRVEREMGGRNLAMKARIMTKGAVMAEGDRPVRAQVEKLLGMDHKSFYTSVFARQKELDALQGVQPAERKKTVLRMLQIDGVDDVLERVRADKNSVSSRIEGAKHTLLAEDGREREAILKERLPALTETLAAAEKEYESASDRERGARLAAANAKERRDTLKKDADGYFSALADLREKRTALDQMVKRERESQERLEIIAKRLERLPEIAAAEAEWRRISALKERLDKDRDRSQRAENIKREISSEEEDVLRRSKELDEMAKGLSSSEDLASKFARIEEDLRACDSEREGLSKRVGELEMRAAERAEASQKDKKKLEEIRILGREGKCPTCERRLDDAYSLLVEKLSETSRAADLAVAEARSEIAKLRSQLEALGKKAEALRRKRSTAEKESRALAQKETEARERTAELERLKGRLAARKRDLAALGEISFSKEEYEAVLRDHSRLTTEHEAFIRLEKEKEHSLSLARDLEAVRAQMARTRADESKFRDIVEMLEPKKDMYETASKEFDQKTDALDKAMDLLRTSESKKNKAAAEAEAARKELDEIGRVKKAIESDRLLIEDLGVLEDVLDAFKHHLIGRVAPVLSELTSRGLEAMTDGRYTSVELDENYQIQIEDQGTLYPLSRYSGGEMDLANLSLRLAISSLIADRTGATPINLLILDEIFGSLDPDRKRSLMAAMSRLSGRFSQIFLITHIEDIRDAISYVIKVDEMEDGTSRASLVS
jgi:exonuclease SbcC